MDVAMNIHGFEIEERCGRRILSSLYGMCSLGGLIGARIGVLTAHQELSPKMHLTMMITLLAMVLAFTAPRLLAVRPTRRSGDPVISLTDWSAVYLRDTLGNSENGVPDGLA